MASLKEDIRFKKCQSSAFRFLKIRLRSIAELRQKLTLKKFDPEIIEQTLKFLKDLDFLDDSLFAQQWICSRLKKPYGPKRIRYELIQKGVSKKIIERELSRALYIYEEERVIVQLARHRAQKYKGLEEIKIHQRVYGFLIRRGFEPSLIYKALKKL